MSELESTDQKPSGGIPGVPVMIVGASVAVLAPLFGLLAGSMAGSPDPDSTGPLFQYFVVGLLIGIVGAAILYLGFRRFRRWQRTRNDSAASSPEGRT